MKKYAVAMVISGIVEADSSSAVRERLEGTLGIFDFVDSLSSTMQIKDGDEAIEIAELLKAEKFENRFFVVCIDKNHVCPADIRHEAQELTIDSATCPYYGAFSCPYSDPNEIDLSLPRCPFDESEP